MLEEDSRQDGLLNGGLGSAAHAVFDWNSSEAMAGHYDFSPYRLLELLGKGGMGAVFLAERGDLHNLVAIKVLRDANVSAARAARFAIEQQALAQLNHPSIARLYDANRLPDGTPYFVMEYVDGQPLDEYCRQHNCTAEQRLRLFRDVCEAVQYAHAHAVIHRDLKPSNILVKPDGEIKSLDFGIAKQLESAEALKDPTLTGLRMMTPAYAAPEQIQGGRTGIHTDVYSLGVILYELLTNRLPFDLSTSTPAEAERIILTRVLEKPSTVAEGNYQNEGLSKTYWDDLDVLCLVAMHKDAERRYRSVEALIRDVDHYLRGEPLEARADSSIYKAGKFLRRHRHSLLAVVVVFATVLSLTIFFVMRLQQRRGEAVSAAAKSQRIEQFMIHLFDGDRRTGPSNELRALDVLDRGSREAQALNKEPQTQGELYQVLGDLYEALGQYDRANSLLQSALTTRTSVFGRRSSEVAETLVSLGLLSAEQAKFPQGERLVREGLSLDSELHKANGFAIARDQTALGKVLEMSGNLKGSRQILETAFASLSRPGAPAADLAGSLDALGTTNFDNGKYLEAESQYEKAFTLYRSIYGSSHPLAAEELMNLGSVQFQLQHFLQAEKNYRAGLEATRAWYGQNNVTVATGLYMLGQTLLKEHRLTEAQPFLTQALAIHEKLYGTVHQNVAVDLNALAIAAQDSGKWSDAERYFTKVLAIENKLYQNQHPVAAMAMRNLGELKRKRGDFSEAETLDRGALKIAENVMPPDHLYTGVIQLALGKVLLAEKRYQEAESHLVKSHEILIKQGNPSMEPLQNVRQALTTTYTALRQKQEAEKYRLEWVRATSQH